MIGKIPLGFIIVCMINKELLFYGCLKQLIPCLFLHCLLLFLGFPQNMQLSTSATAVLIYWKETVNLNECMFLPCIMHDSMLHILFSIIINNVSFV